MCTRNSSNPGITEYKNTLPILKVHLPTKNLSSEVSNMIKLN